MGTRVISFWLNFIIESEALLLIKEGSFLVNIFITIYYVYYHSAFVEAEHYEVMKGFKISLL